MGSTIPVQDGGFGCPQPAELLSVRVDRTDEATVVVVCGEIDLFTASLLSSALAEAMEDDPPVVVVDLADVTFMASSGIAALLEGLDLAAALRCGLRLAGGGRAVRRPLEAAGLDGHFEQYPSVAAAIDTCRKELGVTARTAR